VYSFAKFKPLLARIEATDRLIDRIVYRLYGLTEEEIGVVEVWIAEPLKTLITLKAPSAVSEVSAESVIQRACGLTRWCMSCVG